MILGAACCFDDGQGLVGHPGALREELLVAVLVVAASVWAVVGSRLVTATESKVVIISMVIEAVVQRVKCGRVEQQSWLRLLQLPQSLPTSGSLEVRDG